MPHAHDYKILFEKYRCDVVLGQENTDRDPARNVPDGCRYFRPAPARSNVLYWDPRRINAIYNGYFRLSSPTFYSERWLIWQHFLKANRHARIGAVHLPAFYNRKPRNRIEYDKQELKVARWFEGNSDRILGGDFNGKIGAPRLRHLSPLGRWSKPVPSGPKGQSIDYVGAVKTGRWFPIQTQTHKPRNADHRAVIVTFLWRPARSDNG
jgi:hypothetical protein